MKPKFGRIQLTNAIAGTTSTTYNQVTVTYNSITQLYAGADTRVDRGPKIVKPIL